MTKEALTFKDLIQSLKESENKEAPIDSFRNSTLTPLTYKQIGQIFTFEEGFDDEDWPDFVKTVQVARRIYSNFIKAIQDKKYKKIDENSYLIDINDLAIGLAVNVNKNAAYNFSGYEPGSKTILVAVPYDITDIDKFEKDWTLRGNLIHEIAHHLSTDYVTFAKNYTSPTRGSDEYYTQKDEITANLTSVSEFLISMIKQNIDHFLMDKDITNKEALRIYINRCLNTFMKTPRGPYYNFLQALYKNKPEMLKQLYEKVINTCIQYVDDKFESCLTNAIYNTLLEAVWDL